jgi:hypothetical protein
MINGAEQPVELTEVERLKMENFGLRYTLLQQQLMANSMERTAYIKQIEANHPGSKWDEQRGLIAEEKAPPETTAQA